MTVKKRLLAAAMAVMVICAFGRSTAAPAPKDTARYVAAAGTVPVTRTLPAPAGKVGVAGIVFAGRAGWRGSQIKLIEETGSSGGIGVWLCYSPGGCVDPKNGIQMGWCTKPNGTIDLRKVPLKPGVGLSIRIGVAQPGGVLQNVPGCDNPATTGTIVLTYCKNKKKSKLC